MERLMYLAAVIVVGLFLVSCSSSGLKPTGDPEKDAKALVDYQAQVLKDASNAALSLNFSKVSKINDEANKVAEAFKKFYEDKPELKAKFDEFVNTFNQQNLKEFGKKVEGWFSDKEEKTEEAVGEAAEAVEEAVEKVAE